MNSQGLSFIAGKTSWNAWRLCWNERIQTNHRTIYFALTNRVMGVHSLVQYGQSALPYIIHWYPQKKSHSSRSRCLFPLCSVCYTVVICRTENRLGNFIWFALNHLHLLISNTFWMNHINHWFNHCAASSRDVCSSLQNDFSVHDTDDTWSGEFWEPVWNAGSQLVRCRKQSPQEFYVREESRTPLRHLWSGLQYGWGLPVDQLQ